MTVVVLQTYIERHLVTCLDLPRLKQGWNILKSLNIGDNLDLLIMEPLPTESKVKDARQLALLAKQPVSLKRAKIICGFGSMSLVMESDTSKYGNGLEMRCCVCVGELSELSTPPRLPQVVRRARLELCRCGEGEDLHEVAREGDAGLA